MEGRRRKQKEILPGKFGYPMQALWNHAKSQGAGFKGWLPWKCHAIWDKPLKLSGLSVQFFKNEGKSIFKITEDFLIANIYDSKWIFSGNTQSHPKYIVDFFVQIIHIIVLHLWFGRHRHGMSGCHFISFLGPKSKHWLPIWEEKRV